MICRGCHSHYKQTIYVFGVVDICDRCAVAEGVIDTDPCPGCGGPKRTDDDYCSPECECECFDSLCEELAAHPMEAVEALSVHDVQDVVRR